MKRKRVALFGGSFNPVHVGHLRLAEYVLVNRLAEEVWLLVSPQNPLKEQSELLPEAIRFYLVEKAVEGMKGILACDYEFHLPRPSYTWQTLRHLRSDFPYVSFILMIGADNWHIFPKWAHSEELLSQQKILIYPREGFPIDKEELPSNVRLLETPLFPCSSTDIRRALAAGRDMEEWIPKKIFKDVKKYYMRGSSVVAIGDTE